MAMIAQGAVLASTATRVARSGQQLSREGVVRNVAGKIRQVRQNALRVVRFSIPIFLNILEVEL